MWAHRTRSIHAERFTGLSSRTAQLSVVGEGGGGAGDDIDQVHHLADGGHLRFGHRLRARNRRWNTSSAAVIRSGLCRVVRYFSGPVCGVAGRRR
ncbi:hypothetical protein [Streptomyces bullii]|uniref:Uncharacterized protein n=1 Tax=Streptomyces bullii TaxID=349910 RepID=A0ABW0V0L4_9ACTN